MEAESEYRLSNLATENQWAGGVLAERTTNGECRIPKEQKPIEPTNKIHISVNYIFTFPLFVAAETSNIQC